MERHASRRDENNHSARDMLDGLGGHRQRQLRRGCDERGTQQKNGRTDRAIIVGMSGRGVGRALLRMTSGRRCDWRGARGAVAKNVLAMDVAEGQSELNRQRKQRQPAAKYPVRPEPPHQANPRRGRCWVSRPTRALIKRNVIIALRCNVKQGLSVRTLTARPDLRRIATPGVLKGRRTAHLPH